MLSDKSMCLPPISGESFSAGLLPAKITEICAKTTEVRTAFCIARSTARGSIVSLALRDCLPLSRSLASLATLLFVSLAALATPASLPLPSSPLAACSQATLRAPSARSQAFSRLPTPLAYRELHERHGKTVRCAAAFCNARFLARSLHSDLLLLHSDYFFA